MNKWPNFFIVGAERSGTTSLYEYLKKIPEIYLSPHKEPWYFAPVIRGMSRHRYLSTKINDEESYLKLFEGVKNEPVIGEASAVYWRDPESPKLIYEKNPNAKIIFSLRDPIDRFFSGYLMEFRTGYTKKSIEETVQLRIKNNFTRKSKRLKKETSMLYYDNVKRYLDKFGKNNILILFFEEWINNPSSALKSILEFLKIDSSEKNFDNITFDKFNVGWTPQGKHMKKIMTNKTLLNLTRKMLSKSSRVFLENKLSESNKDQIKLSKEDKQLLIKFFYNDVKKLEKLLGRELPWPNFQY